MISKATQLIITFSTVELQGILTGGSSSCKRYEWV